MTRRKREEKKAVPKRLTRAFHLEAEACGGGEMLLVVSGAKKILQYTEEHLEIDLGASELRICGTALLCRSYSSGAIEVKGGVRNIAFSCRNSEAEVNFEGA